MKPFHSQDLKKTVNENLVAPPKSSWIKILGVESSNLCFYIPPGDSDVC